jgi:putative transposase
MMARRRPAKGQAASRGYREARAQTAKVHKKAARQRQDTARKWAKTVVRDHDAVAVEGFRPKFLTKTTMARKAADAAIGATRTALIEMGRKHARTSASCIPRTPPWTAPRAEPEPSTHSLFPNVPTPAPRAESSCRGTRTPPA